MGEKKTIGVTVDPVTLEEAKKILQSMGLTVSSAVDVFLKAVVRENGIPFSLTCNERTSYAVVDLKEDQK